ncbi:MAG: hypothetical protein JRE43_05295 [Deltaproteobacteria bacterium]|jgi:plastocyanin|nr:hypothetical protein [Deltaproteobacteria bacterium]MBW2543727.1 hypothetical protein [Deltaproteobacteria bacterium]
MADIIENQRGIHAAIIFEEGEVTMVVPDIIRAHPGESVQWIVVPPNVAEVSFKIDNDPMEWDSDCRGHTRIVGTVRRDARGEYKYSVSDGKGNVVDPRLRIKG